MDTGKYFAIFSRIANVCCALSLVFTDVKELKIASYYEWTAWTLCTNIIMSYL